MKALRSIRLVAEREIRERARSRAFLFSTVFVLLIIVAAIAVPDFGRTHKVELGVAETQPAALQRALARQAKPFDMTISVRRFGTVPAALRALEERTIDVLILPDNRLLFAAKPDQKVAAVAEAAVRSLELPARLRALGISAGQAQQLFAPALRVQSLDRSEHDSTDAKKEVALFGSMIMLLALVTYGQWVLVGVVEEKTSRVVEVVMASLRPRHLMAGKVAGIGLLGLAQLALIALVAVGLIVAGVGQTPSTTIGSIALVLPWFVLGFALYAVLFAAAGALVGKQEDASTIGQPITLMLLAAYFLGFISASEAPDGLIAQLATVFPLTAPLAVPSRSAVTSVPLWQHALAVLLTLGAIWGLVRLAGRIYELGLLRAGARPTLRAVWQLATTRTP
jgi:ABC-2 type transport system permease protein